MLKIFIVLTCFGGAAAFAQEAASGFELRTTLTGAAIYSNQLARSPRSGSATEAGFRAMLYPTWKINSRWTVFGAVQVHTRPFFAEQFTTAGRGLRGDVLQAHLSYSRFWDNKSVVVRVGQLSSAFGAFLLRYDDAENPLIDMPLSYGYYYKGVTTYGLAGAQIEVTTGKIDVRAQFVNSSPANRRSILDADQYGNWAGGAGYTITQGLRVGTSAYRGPYLHRQYAWYRPGEAKPRDLPASAVGVDVQFARGHWSSHAEWQWFHRPYRAVPTLTQKAGYAETRRVLHPRWFAAVRAGYLSSSSGSSIKACSFAIGFRPHARQLVKIGYDIQRGAPGARADGSIVVQLVTSLRPLSIARD